LEIVRGLVVANAPAGPVAGDDSILVVRSRRRGDELLMVVADMMGPPGRAGFGIISIERGMGIAWRALFQWKQDLGNELIGGRRH
jgi:hypothetical protein